MNVWRGIEDYETEIRSHLERNFFRVEHCDYQKIEYFIHSLAFVGDSTNINQFHFLLRLKAHIHFAQDLNLFTNYVKQVIPIFMDIDYLQMIFNTKFNLLHKKNLTTNRLMRINAPAFSCALIESLSTKMGEIQLSKGYSPQEYNRNKVSAAIKSRFRKKKERKFSVTFGYQDWYATFFSNHDSVVKDSEEFFDVKLAEMTILENSTNLRDESSCMPFSRIIELTKALRTHCSR